MLSFLVEVWLCTGPARGPFTGLLAAPASQQAAGPTPQFRHVETPLSMRTRGQMVSLRG